MRCFSGGTKLARGCELSGYEETWPSAPHNVIAQQTTVHDAASNGATSEKLFDRVTLALQIVMLLLGLTKDL